MSDKSDKTARCLHLWASDKTEDVRVFDTLEEAAAFIAERRGSQGGRAAA